MLFLHLVQNGLKNPAFSEEREWRLISMLFSFAARPHPHGDLSKSSIEPGEIVLSPTASCHWKATQSPAFEWS
ncbi:hypothetical protein AOQ73_27960 [Bradyrhizobium pachyrhizi]|nr:hypothetical protein AOQ73_27960 [Bradyrhizobium pachyrhizi]